MPVTVTALYASLLAIVYVVLSLRVARRRLRFRVGLGTGQNAELEQAIRVHGNFAEYVPFALLLMALFESGGGPAWSVHAAGAALLVARLLHVLGLTRSPGRSPGRFAGVVATWLVTLGLAAGNLALYVASTLK
jgi:hypothetical protein